MFSRFLILLILALSISGCASIINSASEKMADNLSRSMLNQNDLEIVGSGLPAYLIMVDSLVEGDPENTSMLISAAKLNGAYTSAFVQDEERQKRLSEKSYAFAHKALCLDLKAVCAKLDGDLEALQAELNRLTAKQQPLLYNFAASWAGWIQAHSDDWNAVAQIPKLTAIFKRSAELTPNYDYGGAYVYLGVLAAQIPPSLGGKPEQARAYFETAEKLSDGKNLMVDVLFAEHYARLVFDQGLHDRLLNNVLAANAEVPGLTLINTLAQKRAAQLLQESEDFF
jgi:uncharacterized protein YceK